MRNVIYSAIILFLVSSCAIPENIVRIESTENDIDWLMGKQVITKTEDSITIALKYEQKRGDYVLFDTELFNQSSEKVMVSPRNFSIVEINNTSTNKRWIAATNPEEVLLKKDIEISRSIAAQKNAATTSLIVGTALLATDIAKTTSRTDTPEKSAARGAVAGMTYITAGAIHNANVRNEEYGLRDRVFWAHDVLRKTTLYPGESIRGYVLFPRENLFDSFGVEIRLQEKVFDFNYKLYSIPANNY